MSNAPRVWRYDKGAWLCGATLPVDDRGVRYGMSVFETIGVSRGQPLLLPEHLALLTESARILFDVNVSVMNSPALDPTDTGVLRIYVTAGQGSPTSPVNDPSIFAIFEQQSTAPANEQTARLHPEPVAPFAHGRKTGNYWLQCAAQAEAVRAGFGHALLADHGGHILSAAFGNLFFVLHGELCTPALSLAVRTGVIRSWVGKQQTVREVEFPAARLAEVSELFLTNSRLGIMPLYYGEIAPGPVGRSLREAILREKLVP